MTYMRMPETGQIYICTTGICKPRWMMVANVDGIVIAQIKLDPIGRHGQPTSSCCHGHWQHGDFPELCEVAPGKAPTPLCLPPVFAGANMEGIQLLRVQKMSWKYTELSHQTSYVDRSSENPRFICWWGWFGYCFLICWFTIVSAWYSTYQHLRVGADFHWSPRRLHVSKHVQSSRHEFKLIGCFVSSELLVKLSDEIDWSPVLKPLEPVLANSRDKEGEVGVAVLTTLKNQWNMLKLCN